MPRRPAALLALLFAACKAGAPTPEPSPSPAARPNVVLIVVDTLRADHLPMYGSPRDTAPFLTTLARGAVVFDRAYATSGWTIPSTASIFTSLYPPQHGLTKNLKVVRREGRKEQQMGALPAAVPTVTEVLRAAGYATFGVVDNPIVSARRGFDRGFDRFATTRNGGAEVVAEKALAWKDRLHERAPYFLYLHFNDPHHPYLKREPYFEAFAKDGQVKELPRSQDAAAYDSEIRWLDDHLKALHDALDWDHGTIVILTADHGEEFGDHGNTGHSNSIYGELIDVPLIVRGPYAARRIDLPVSQVDLLPTLRELAGLPSAASDQGKSFVPVMLQKTAGDARRTLFAHILPFGHGHEIRGVIEGRWKLVDPEAGARQLFDLSADRAEKADQYATEKRTGDRLTEVYRRYMAATPHYEGTESSSELDAETEENLRALGYVK